MNRVREKNKDILGKMRRKDWCWRDGEKITITSRIISERKDKMYKNKNRKTYEKEKIMNERQRKTEGKIKINERKRKKFWTKWIYYGKNKKKMNVVKNKT